MAWSASNKYIVDFVDMAAVASGSVSKDPDCRICDLKLEFNKQINASSAVLCIIGKNTAVRNAGSACPRSTSPWSLNKCTPYKRNFEGAKYCRVHTPSLYHNLMDVNCINTYSYLRHEFEQAQKKGKQIIVIYNSLYKQPTWLPSYLKHFENHAFAFWMRNCCGNIVGNYAALKKALGYE